MEEITVHLEAEVNPTESEEKVKEAIQNVFGNISLQTKSSMKKTLITAEANGKEALAKFYNLLVRDRIRAAARSALLAGIQKKAVIFCLNKQVAYAGHISFSEEIAESPLGPIKVKIESKNPHEIINWLTSINF